MRANGGFFGSYAVIEVSPGTVAGTPDSSQVEPTYQLNLLKQNGLESSPQEINLFGNPISTDLTTDFSITNPFSATN